MGDKSINIIIMRDQSKSFTFGFSAQTFRIIIGTLVLVPLFLIASIVFGLTYYNKYIANLEESVLLRKTIEQNRQTVTRLANLERFLQKYSPDMLGILVPTEEVDINHLPVIKGDKELLMSELAANLAGEQMSFDILVEEKQEKQEGQLKQEVQAKQEEQAENAGLSGEHALKTADNQQDVAENAGQEKDVQPTGIAEEKQKELVQEQAEIIPSQQVPEIPAVSENKKLSQVQKIDLGYVSIEQATVKIAAQKINANFALKNTGKKNFVQGDIRFYIYSEINGKFELQELNKITDDSFKIRNLKNFKSSMSIMGIKIGEKAQLVIEVLIDDAVTYRQMYPIIR